MQDEHNVVEAISQLMRIYGLLLLAASAVAGAALLGAPSLAPTPLVTCPRSSVRRSRLSMAAAAAPEEDDDTSRDAAGPNPVWGEQTEAAGASDLDMAQLADRISSVKDKVELQSRLLALDQAWVLVFDADTDDEAVYSMEMHGEDEGGQVVLAFESDTEARTYAESLQDDAYDGEVASVQALDVEALVVTSREASFRVGIVFAGDLSSDESEPTRALITGTMSPIDRLSLSITIVPDEVFEDKTSADFLDPAEDPVWVLVHDAGTADAQYFTMRLNGTSSIVCFKDSEAAERCSAALQIKGAAHAKARSLLLEELLDSIDDDDVEVCLVDEVVETVSEEAESGVLSAHDDATLLGTFPLQPADAGHELAVASGEVRAMLDRLYDGESGQPGEGAS